MTGEDGAPRVGPAADRSEGSSRPPLNSQPHGHPVPPPRHWLADGTWPDGRIEDDAPAATAKTATAARLVRRHVAEFGADPVAARCGADVGELERFLAGDDWPTLDLLARLEQGLGVRLW